MYSDITLKLNSTYPLYELKTKDKYDSLITQPEKNIRPKKQLSPKEILFIKYKQNKKKKNAGPLLLDPTENKIEGLIADYNLEKNWQIDQAYFEGIKLNINIHNNAVFRDNHEDWATHFGVSKEAIFLKEYENCNNGTGGLATLKINSKKFFQIQIAYSLLTDNNQTAFNKGHEQGHALIYLGQLTPLFNETELMGLNFDFFTKDIAKDIDKSAQKMLSYTGTKNDFNKTWNLDYHLCENIANIAGVVSMIKSGTNQTIVSDIIQTINSRYKYNGNRNPFEPF